MEKRKFKTKKILSGVRTEYRAWKEWTEGDIIVCKLLGTSPNKQNDIKNDWIVEAIEVCLADKKEEKRLKPGTRMTLNSAGQLDKGMAQADIGDVVQITYNGTNEIMGGKWKGKEAHLHEVVIVEEDTGEEEETEEEEEEDL